MNPFPINKNAGIQRKKDIGFMNIARIKIIEENKSIIDNTSPDSMKSPFINKRNEVNKR